LLYTGSLNTREQDPRPLLEALRDLAIKQCGCVPACLALACSESAFESWKNEAERIGASECLRWLGWLDERELQNAMCQANALVLIPLATPARPGVPSKLFAYLASGRPVLVAGPDSGGLASLFSEWRAPSVLCENAGRVREALERLMAGDATLLLQRSTLGNAPVTERDLGEQYLQWATSAAAKGVPEQASAVTPATAR
jgi:hypothetical protein